jgi:hypothetical protein
MKGDAGVSDRMKQLEEWDVPLHLRVGAKRSEPSQRHRGESAVARGRETKKRVRMLGIRVGSAEWHGIDYARMTYKVNTTPANSFVQFQ